MKKTLQSKALKRLKQLLKPDSLNKAELNHFLAQQALKSQKKHLNHKFTRWFKSATHSTYFLAACEFLVRNGYIDAYLLPAPSSLWQSFLDLAHSDLFAHIYISTWRVLFGFIIGSGLGFNFCDLGWIK